MAIEAKKGQDGITAKIDHNTKATLTQNFSETENAFKLMAQAAIGVEEGLNTVRFFAAEYTKIKDDVLAEFKNKKEFERLSVLMKSITANINKVRQRNERYTLKLADLFKRNKGKKKLEGKTFDRYLDYSTRFMSLAELVYVDIYNAIREFIDILGEKYEGMWALQDKYDIANYDGQLIQESIEEEAAKAKGKEEVAEEAAPSTEPFASELVNERIS